MNKNPFSQLIEIMRREGIVYNPPSLMLGEVVSEYPNLIIKTSGIPLHKDDLIACQGSGYQSLIAGDQVLLFPTTDKQKFILIDKVVSLA